MKKIVIISCLFIGLTAGAQELYVFSEPASNIPAHAALAKLGTLQSNGSKPAMQRLLPELSYGVNKKLMLRLGNSFSDMQSKQLRWESVYLYGKYRFYSADDVHRHFRMAAFSEIAFNRNQYQFDEVNLRERSGIEAGVVATQLIHKFAISGTVSHIQGLDNSRFEEKNNLPPERKYSALGYNLSAGLLLLPRTYKNYKQANLNVYLELLGQQTLDHSSYFTDLAPALQLIIGSNTKINAGYRFQLGSNQLRSIRNSFVISVERSLLNVLKR